MGLDEWLDFLSRQWLWVVSIALLFGLMTVGVMLLLTPRLYQTSASLIVVPSEFSSELKPAPLSLQGYQRLLESNAVIDTTARRLADQKVLESPELRLGRDLESRIFVDPRAQETTLAPIIEAIARAEDSMVAATIANTWADVFVEKSRELTLATTFATANFIDSQYERKRKEVEDLEEQFIQLANSYDKRIDKLADQWDGRLDEAVARWDENLLAHGQQTEEMLAAFQLETRQAIEDYVKRQGLSRDPEGPARPHHAQLLRLVSLRIQLAQTPRLLVLEKGLSDDAVWQALAAGESDADRLQPLLSYRLQSQEANPLYAELALQVSQAELDLEGATEEVADQAWIRRLSSGLEEIQRNRSAGLAKLVAARLSERGELEREKEAEIIRLERSRGFEMSSIFRQKDFELSQTERRLTQGRDLLSTLGKSYEQANLARAEQMLQDVWVGSRAVPPKEPLSRRLAIKALAAVLLGSVVGLAIARLRELRAT